MALTVLRTLCLVVSQKISYIYSADGIKQRKVVTDNTVITTTDYAGSYIYENSSLKFISQGEGYVEPDGAGGYDYVYQYKDHLGNILLSYSDSDNNGLVDSSEIVEESNYYPFGLKHRGYNNILNGQQNRFLTYNGKEWEESLNLNLYEMDMRQYDPAIARWIVQDPVVHHSISSYNAFDNNPVFWADPSGADAQTLLANLQDYTDKEGKKPFNKDDDQVDFAEDGNGGEGASLSSENNFEGNQQSSTHPKKINLNNKDHSKIIDRLVEWAIYIVRKKGSKTVLTKEIAKNFKHVDDIQMFRGLTYKPCQKRIDTLEAERRYR